MTRFRSIHAFKDYEQKQQAAELTPLRVLGLLKRSPSGLRKREIAQQLNANLTSVDAALLDLIREEVVKVERADRPDDDLVVF